MSYSTAPSTSLPADRASAATRAMDRAAVTATAILQRVEIALLTGLRGDPDAVTTLRAAIEADLREQFEDVAQITLSEIRREDG
jgi:hypothetical protein